MSYNSIYEKVGMDAELTRLKNQAEVNWDKELKVLKSFGIKDGDNILEVGSGPGFYTKLLLKEFPNITITSLEINSKFIDYAKQYLGELSNRVYFFNSPIEKTSLPSSNYDIVLSRLVYQHLSKPIQAINESYRLLKKGGKNIILDIDNELWGTTYPYNHLINMTNKSMDSFQKNSGGDRSIGKKLLPLLKNSNFKNLDFEVIATHTDVVGMEKFLGGSIPTSVQQTPAGVHLNKYQLALQKDYIDFLNSKDSLIILLMMAACGQK